jgi:hypothetical protein
MPHRGELADGLVLGVQAVVGDVAGDHDRVQAGGTGGTGGEGVEVGEDPARALGGAGSGVDVDVADVRDDNGHGSSVGSSPVHG